jgi:putative FmdB family regulatory protein
MPTYDYKCSSCGYTFEYFQPMSDKPLTECPKCKGILKRIIGMGAGPIFKGSGFYQTDYKGKSTPGTNEKTEKAPDKSKESSSKKNIKEDKK